MANTLTPYIPYILAQALPILRQNTPAILNVDRRYEPTAGEKGSSINIPVPTTGAVQDVIPSPNQPTDTPDVTTNNVIMTFDYWKKADFYLTDSEMLQVSDGFLPIQMQQRIADLGTAINNSVLSLYKDIYNYVGTPGVSPFATDTAVARAAATVLTINNTPTSNRKAIIDPYTYGDAIGRPEFANTSYSSDNAPIIEGALGRKLGFDWYVQQGVPTHVPGTATGITTSATNAAGTSTVVLKAASGTVVKGDILTFAGNTQSYVVTADTAGNTTFTLTTGGVPVPVSPPLLVTVDGSTTAVNVTKLAQHTANIAFDPMAIAFASRPLETTVDADVGGPRKMIVDPITQVALRFEITRQNYRTRYSFDCLWGIKTIRPQCAVRILA